MNQRYVSAVADALGVREREPGIERAASIFRGLEFEYAHLQGEVMHGLTKDARPEMVRRIREAYDHAKEWVEETTGFARIVAGPGKGQIEKMDFEDHRVAKKTAKYLERVLEQCGTSVYSF